MTSMFIQQETQNLLNQVYNKSFGDFLGLLADDPQFFKGKKTKEELIKELITDQILLREEEIKIRLKNEKEKQKLKRMKKKEKKQAEMDPKDQCQAKHSKNGIEVKRCLNKRNEEEAFCEIHSTSTLPYGYVSDDPYSYLDQDSESD